MAFENTAWGRVKLVSTHYHGIALRFRSRSFSYDYLKDAVNSFASRLYNFGIRKDDVVCIACPNIPSAIFAMYAINSLGAINFIVHPLIPKKVLEEDLRKTNAKLLLVLDQRYSEYKDITICPIFTLSPRDELSPLERFAYPIVYRNKIQDAKGRNFKDLPTSYANPPLNDDEYKPSFYLSSGGTTGRSKIVVLNDAAINFQGEKVAWILGEDYKHARVSAMLGFLPMFHGFGLAMGIHCPLVNYAASDLMVTYDEKEIGRLIRKNELQYMIVVPYLAKRMLRGKMLDNKSVKNLTTAFIGADKTNPTVFSEFDKLMEKHDSKCRLLEGYGLTETVTVVVVNRLTDRKEGSVGKPFPDITIKIIDKDGNKLPANTDGQICISGPCLALGYLNDKETTDKVFVTDDAGIRWVLTGDEGHLDEDGFLFIKGRQKDMFKISGYNIFPSEVEDIANRVKGVENCACVYIDDQRHPYAHLYIKKDGTVDDDKLIDDVMSTLSENLIKYAVPEKVSIIGKLPYTNVGKVDKKKLVQLDLNKSK